MFVRMLTLVHYYLTPGTAEADRNIFSLMCLPTVIVIHSIDKHITLKATNVYLLVALVEGGSPKSVGIILWGPRMF